MVCRRKWENRDTESGRRKPKRIICPYVKRKEAEKGNGEQITRIFYKENMIPMNTWETPPLSKKEKEQMQQSDAPTRYLEQIHQEHLDTWVSPNVQIKRQIDYIAINQPYRNTVRKAWADQAWRGNMTQKRQHATILLDIALKLAQHYRKKPPPETGKNPNMT